LNGCKLSELIRDIPKAGAVMYYIIESRILNFQSEMLLVYYGDSQCAAEPFCVGRKYRRDARSKSLIFTDASPSTFEGLDLSKGIRIYSETDKSSSHAHISLLETPTLIHDSHFARPLILFHLVFRTKLFEEFLSLRCLPQERFS
jgi:hypothetical protein